MEQNKHLMIITTMLEPVDNRLGGGISETCETIEYFENLIKENEKLKKVIDEEVVEDKLKWEAIFMELRSDKEKLKKEKKYLQKEIENYKINEEQKELLINDLKTKLKDEKENKKEGFVVSYENGELFEMVKEFGLDVEDEEDFDIYKFIDDVHRQLGKMETKELKIKELESKIQKHKKVIMELLE